VSQRLCERLSAHYLSLPQSSPGLGDLIDQSPKPGKTAAREG
jgi:hypothetical protein